MSLESLDLAALRAAYAAGVPPQSVVDHCFARLAAVNDPGIFISPRARADVLADCARLGAFDPVSKPLWGIPFAVKDNIDVAGLPTTAACPDFTYHPTASATAVTRLQEAGAILLGKTNLDQFATGLVGTRTPYPVPRNALDLSLVPGGSSSGSGVAVAQGIVSFALGTDTAGSGRVPAALNNIVGLKPSLGLISTRGVFPACRSLDCVSIFALCVQDAFDVLKACAGYDPHEPFSRVLPFAEPRPPVPLRLGVPTRDSLRFFGDGDAQKAFESALAKPVFAQAEHIDIDLAPFYATAALLYEGAWVAERYEAIRGFIETRPDSLHPVTREITLGALRFSAADAFAGFYRLAELRRQTQSVWEHIDCLVVPTIPTVVTLDEIAADPIGPNSRLGTYTNFVNLLDLCGLAVPGPWRADGRPAGVTLLAPAGQDALLAGVAGAFHVEADVRMGATGVALPSSSLAPPRVADDLIELAVVGAHLSGMPLNGELVGLGAIFRRSTETAPCYRLYALPGGPPARPGLLRVAEKEGHAIALEIWALSPANFGRFVASIPAPLTIGTVALADGTSVKGFLCEAEALREAQDISHHGGWRAFMAAGEGADGA